MSWPARDPLEDLLRLLTEEAVLISSGRLDRLADLQTRKQKAMQRLQPPDTGG